MALRRRRSFSRDAGALRRCGALAGAGTLATSDYLAAPGQPPLRAQRLFESDERYDLWELSAQ